MKLMSNKEYVESLKDVCPKCRMGDPEFGDAVFNSRNEVLVDAECDTCRFQWTEIFVLNRYDPSDDEKLNESLNIDFPKQEGF